MTTTVHLPARLYLLQPANIRLQLFLLTGACAGARCKTSSCFKQGQSSPEHAPQLLSPAVRDQVYLQSLAFEEVCHIAKQEGLRRRRHKGEWLQAACGVALFNQAQGSHHNKQINVYQAQIYRIGLFPELKGLRCNPYKHWTPMGSSARQLCKH